MQECQLHRGEQTTGQMPLSYISAYHSGCLSSITICRCTDYTGDQCTSVFSTANIFTPVGDSITTLDNSVNNFLAGVRLASAFTSISETCQDYLRIAQCLSVYTPCNGTAWCGSMSPDDLTAAINSACDCSATIGTTCTIGPPPPITNYYQGSSSTGRVGSAMLTCQDVTVGKRC